MSWHLASMASPRGRRHWRTLSRRQPRPSGPPDVAFLHFAAVHSRACLPPTAAASWPRVDFSEQFTSFAALAKLTMPTQPTQLALPRTTNQHEPCSPRGTGTLMCPVCSLLMANLPCR